MDLMHPFHLAFSWNGDIKFISIKSQTSRNGLKVAKAGYKSEGHMGMMDDRHDGMMADMYDGQ